MPLIRRLQLEQLAILFNLQRPFGLLDQPEPVRIGPERGHRGLPEAVRVDPLLRQVLREAAPHQAPAHDAKTRPLLRSDQENDAVL